MQLKRILLTLATALVLPVASYATPVVSQASGTFSEKGAVKITGASFGSKSAASPMIWDNFEAGATGQQVMTSNAVIGQWQTGAGYDHPAYSTEQAHAGSKSAKMSATGGVYNLSLDQNGSYPVLYMDWYVRLHYYDLPSRNWKPWRVYGDNDAMQANAVIMCDSSGMSIENEAGGGGFWWDNMGFGQNTWQHYQVLLKESSSPGTADGKVVEYINGKLISNHSGVITRTNSAHWEQIRIGHFWASDAVDNCPANSGADIFVDSIYLDTSWAHVEIGNNSTYAASDHREIQVPTSWSDNSIQVTMNQGTFAAGSTAYVYVIDSSGNVNAAGMPIKIGGTSSTTTTTTVPNPPTNVTVN
jgi:hypothetical protein